MKAPDRIDLKCPLCGGTVNVGLYCRPVLTADRSYEVHITAYVSAGVASHHCPAIYGQRVDVDNADALGG